MPKYHVNDDGVAGVCRASKRPCKFGGATGQENHFESKEEAVKAGEAKIAKENKNLVTSMKRVKKMVPESFRSDSENFNKLAPEVRAEVLMAEYLVNHAELGDYPRYGHENFNIKDDVRQRLEAVGAIDAERKVSSRRGASGNSPVTMRSILDKGFTASYVPNSMGDEGFSNGFGDGSESYVTSFRAVITSPDGVSLEVPVSINGSYSENARAAASELQRGGEGTLANEVHVNAAYRTISELSAKVARLEAVNGDLWEKLNAERSMSESGEGVRGADYDSYSYDDL